MKSTYKAYHNVFRKTAQMKQLYRRHHGANTIFIKNGPVESECKLNNVNPHIIRNQYQIQNKQRVLTPGHQGWNDLHSLCRTGMQ